jgi:hypothetical protein
MTYKVGGIIQASDFNSLVGPSATASTGEQLNTILGVGTGRWGYGQTPISNVSEGTTITATAWDDLVNAVNKVADHQGVYVWYTRNGSFTSGSRDIYMTNTSNLQAFMIVTAPGIPLNAYISSITPGVKITLNVETTATYTLNVLFRVSSQVAPPVVDSVIKYSAPIKEWISLSYKAKNDAVAHGTTDSTSGKVITQTTWKDKVIVTHIVTFESGDKARYFFNSGGQLGLTFSFESPTSSAIDQLFTTLGTNSGGVILGAAAPNSSTTVATVNYAGTTKIGGSGSAYVNYNVGYYELTKSYQTIFTQKATGTPAGYLNSNITVFAKSNGTQGTHSDNGSTITFQTVWDQIPNGIYVTGSTAPAGVTTSVNIRYPSTEFISNSWGTVSVSGTSTAM